MNQFDTSSQKQVNINCSGPKSDIDLCHSTPNVNMNKLDDTKSSLNTSSDNGDDIIPFPDERSVTKSRLCLTTKIPLVVELLHCQQLRHSCK